MSSFVACLESTLDGATASKYILAFGLTLTEAFHSTFPIQTQYNSILLLFFSGPNVAQMGNELLFNYHPAFNILWPILSHVYLYPLSYLILFF